MVFVIYYYEILSIQIFSSSAFGQLKDGVWCQIMILKYSVYYCPLTYSKQNLRLMKNLMQKVIPNNGIWNQTAKECWEIIPF